MKRTAARDNERVGARDATFAFRTVLRKTPGHPFYWIAVPKTVSRELGRRGPVPIAGTINGATEVRASLVPIGEGRHRLQLNARARAEAGIEPGDRVEVALRVDDDPHVELPPDLAEALRDSGSVASFERLPPGKRRHIVAWVEEAVADRTREKRIAQVVAGSLKSAESDYDREPSSRAATPVRRR